MVSDFGMAEEFLQKARTAHAKGDEAAFIAARHMILIALGLSLVPAMVKRSGEP